MVQNGKLTRSRRLLAIPSTAVWTVHLILGRGGGNMVRSWCLQFKPSHYQWSEQSLLLATIYAAQKELKSPDW